MKIAEVSGPLSTSEISRIATGIAEQLDALSQHDQQRVLSVLFALRGTSTPTGTDNSKPPSASWAPPGVPSGALAR